MQSSISASYVAFSLETSCCGIFPMTTTSTMASQFHWVLQTRMFWWANCNYRRSYRVFMYIFMGPESHLKTLLAASPLASWMTRSYPTLRHRLRCWSFYRVSLDLPSFDWISGGGGGGVNDAVRPASCPSFGAGKTTRPFLFPSVRCQERETNLSRDERPNSGGPTPMTPDADWTFKSPKTF